MSAKVILTIVFVVMWWLCVYISTKASIDNDSIIFGNKYEPTFSGILLPIALFVSFIMDLLIDGFDVAFMTFVNNCANLMLCISVYYLLVFLLLRLFRKYLHPLVVSTIWMLPNILYFFIMYRSNNYTNTNAYIFEVSSIVMYLLIAIWFIGFVFILIYKILEHFNYRKSILEDAVEIIDQNIIKIFDSYLEKISNKREIKLMKSNHVHTPLTIGVRNQVLVLPNINYTEEELKLILKHEIIHIGRGDVLAKFHLVFCNALCWFNPLMWMANKKCSEDLELSCDTSVLANEENTLRKQYARLILKNANSEKGFTTCLSADAKSLQYRLENIVQPKKKKKGFIIFLVLIILLGFSWGNIGIAAKGYQGDNELFHSKKVELTNIIRMNTEFKNEVFNLEHSDKIIDYFSSLELSKVIRMNLLEEDSNKNYWFYFKRDSETICVMVYDHFIRINNDENATQDQYYYVKGGIDWAYLDELIYEYPTLKLSMLVDEVDLGYKLWPVLRQVSKNGKIVYETNNNYFHKDYSGFCPTEFGIDFYDEVTLLSDIQVIEETEEGIKKHVIDKENLTLIKTPKSDVNYTIKATCEIYNQIYDITYTFDLEYWYEK